MPTPISLATIGTTYTQNFDTLAATGTSSTLPVGWSFVETGAGADNRYTASDGSLSAGDTYSFGTTDSTDRAFGTIQSGSVLPTIGAFFVNNTGRVISALDIAYTGEQWRLGTANGKDRLDFQYSLNAADLSGGTWSDANALDFSTRAFNGVRATDGNVVDNRSALIERISGLGIAPGATFAIRWTDTDATGQDDGLSVDDFSLTPQGMPVLSNVAPTAAYVAGTAGTNLSPALAVAAGTNLASATVKIANSYLLGDQLFVNLSADGSGHFIAPGAVTTNITVGSNSLGTLVLTGADTPAHYQQVLDAVSYRSTVADPSAGGFDPTRAITWQVNDGTPVVGSLLQPQIFYRSGLASFGLTIADLNGDGILDISTSNGGNLAILQGHGDGIFERVANLSASSIAAGDVNGDGKPDLVAITTNGISVTLGAVSFVSATNFAADSFLEDFNHDGKADLAFTRNDGGTFSVLVMLNTTPAGGSTASFASAQNVAAGATPAVGDFNGDGKPDLALVDGSSGNIAILINTTTSAAPAVTFGPPQGLTVGGGRPAIADLNGDGRPDLVSANFDTGIVSVLLNTTPIGSSTASFTSPQQIDTGAGANGLSNVAIGDLNGDGKLDLVVAGRLNQLIFVLFGNGDGTFAAAQNFATVANPGAVGLGDFNGDGALDVADIGLTGVSILLNNSANVSRIASTQLLLPINAAPVNTVPGTQEVEANASAAITGLQVADADAGSGTMMTTLSVVYGMLTVAPAGGAAIAGSGTGTVTLTGTLAQIDTTLAAAGNIVYSGAHDFFGTDTLTMVTNDGGNTGSGGVKTDTDQVTLHVNTLLTGTSGDNSFTALPGNERIDALGGNDTIMFNFKLVDATVSYVGNTVVIDSASSHTVLTGFESYAFTDGTVNENDGSPLVDDLYYDSQYHDVWNAHVDADQHYNQSGWHEGRSPNPYFNTQFYLAVYSDVKASGANPLTQYDQTGWKLGRDPSLNFDTGKYLAANPDVAAANIDPLAHFVQFGREEGRQAFAVTELIAPNGFDYVYYLQHNPDVAAARVDPFQHYETYGWKEGRNPNALFDDSGYLAHYPDVTAAGVNPLDHYHQFGWHEGRDPSVGFDTTSYLAAYPDVAAANIDPLAHYLAYGIHEGRSAFADGVWG